MAQINITQKFSAFIVMMLALFFYSACGPSHKQEVDRLNALSYAYHYRNLDSTKMLAQRALALSDDYSAGYAEACNNLAFVEMAKMNYKEARRWLGLVEEKSNNQLELLIADVQMMRICQRESHNKDFYSYREKAMVRLRRLGEEASNLPPRERRRATYAHSEFDIVDATYCYYVGLEESMLKALNDIDADALEADTAQYLNYLYNIGSGGAITNGTSEQIAQTEFDYLIQCYMLASAGRVVMPDGTMAGGYPYWQANALQAISEHLIIILRATVLFGPCRWARISSRLPIWWLLSVNDFVWYILRSIINSRVTTTAISTLTYRSEPVRTGSWKLAPPCLMTMLCSSIL